MSWFKVDDSAHSHPKMRRAGKAAVGLWVMCGSYASAYLTDGVIPGETANREGSPQQIAKLVRVGLWHGAGHTCPRCPQPAAGDYFIHDYGVYNPSRAKVLAEREKAAEKKRQQRAGAPSGGGGPAGSGEKVGEKTTSNKVQTKSFSSFSEGTFFDESAGEEPASPGYSPGYRARAARPAPEVPPNGGTSTASHATRASAVPDRLRPLAKALSAAGLGAVAWDITKITDWERVRLQVERLGTDLMVESALAAAQRRGKPDSVTAWINRWESLTDPQPPSTDVTAAGPNVYPITSARGPAGTDANLAGHAALIAQLAAMEGQQ
ncbi:hypothetical protein [Streptacidiphilus cavernicola]|uniref:Mucin-2 n=1 Tax=Streptacidiphilus cavernicola TaxID=3342716 RepID=A0ABV6W464_9ACTN